MLSAPTLSQVLRSAIGMRDKVVVVRLDAGDAAALTTAASSLALLRALDLRVIVVLDTSGAAPDKGEGKTSAAQLVGAIARHEQRAVTLMTAGVISVHKLMIAAPPTSVMTPRFIPVVDQVLLTQLCTLRYIPILLLPVVDGSGESVDMPADEVAAAVAKFMDAALLLFVRQKGGSRESPAVDSGGRRTLTTSAAAPDELLSDIFLQ